MNRTDKEYAEILKSQLSYATEGHPLYPLNVPISDLWAAMNRAIDLLENGIKEKVETKK